MNKPFSHRVKEIEGFEDDLQSVMIAYAIAQHVMSKEMIMMLVRIAIRTEMNMAKDQPSAKDAGDRIAALALGFGQCDNDLSTLIERFGVTGSVN